MMMRVQHFTQFVSICIGLLILFTLHASAASATAPDGDLNDDGKLNALDVFLLHGLYGER